MALVTNFLCSVCNQDKYEVVTYDRICLECRANESKKAERMHFAALKGLTVEERLEKIEKWIYNFDKKTLPTLSRNNKCY